MDGNGRICSCSPGGGEDVLLHPEERDAALPTIYIFFHKCWAIFKKKLELKLCEMATEKRATWTPFGSQLNGVTSAG